MKILGYAFLLMVISGAILALAETFTIGSGTTANIVPGSLHVTGAQTNDSDLWLGSTNVAGAIAGKASTASIPGAANPTATIGVSAVNGTAATFMRSDGAPALGTITEGTLTHAGTVTLDFTSVYTVSKLTLTGSVTIATSNLAAGHEYLLILEQAQSTNATPTFPSPAWNFGGGAPSTLTAGKVSWLWLRSRGTVNTNVIAAFTEAQ